MEKFDRNVARDELAVLRLQEAGFITLVIWECEAEGGKVLEGKLDELDALLSKRGAR